MQTHQTAPSKGEKDILGMMQSLRGLTESFTTSTSQGAGNPANSRAEAEAWYIAWYNRQGNAIRKHDEQHGIELVVEDGCPSFVMDRAVLDNAAMAGTQIAYPWPERKLDDFSVLPYAPQNRDMATKAQEVARRWVQKYSRLRESPGAKGLYFVSTTSGSGKTLLASAVGAELVRQNVRTQFIGMPYLLDEIKAGYDRESGTSSAQIIQSASNIPLLILDDLGAEKQSAWVNETVYKILTYRENHMLLTVFTSNIRIEELEYQDRVKNRIESMAVQIQMPEESIRRKFSRRNGERFMAELLGV